MNDQKQFKRAPAVYRKIAEIMPEKDIHVRLLGRVIGKSDGIVVIDDGTG
ncbi:MAG: replication protein RepA, partial [Candidatus Aenigmarchaeota archaeon]|nr:replication protein RepA [Candidatus Aenigmarchaeota archaeon]